MGTAVCPFCGKKVNKFIMFRGDVVGCRFCGIHTKQTNADRIRSMTDEELAERFYLFMCVHVLDVKVKCKDDGCKKCWLNWLRDGR